MMKKVLPVHKPMVRGYLNYAYQMAVIGQLPHAQHWIFQNYIQLVSDVNSPLLPVQFYLPDASGYNWSPLCPLLEHQLISRDVLIQHQMEFIDVIMESIRQNRYICIHVNERYIPGTAAEQRQQNFNHMIMIHGFDQEAGEFAFYGYDAKGQLSSRTVKVDQMKQGFFDNTYNYEQFESKLIIMRPRDEVRFHLRLDYIIDQLKDFVRSRATIRNVMDYDQGYQLLYGLDTYDFVNKNLKLMALQERDVDVTALHVIGEHKLMMAERLKFLMNQFPSLRLDGYIQSYTQYKDEFFAMRNYLLKLEFTGELERVDSIIDKIQRIKQEEQPVLEALIEALQQENDTSLNP